jgi:hypothetical protein
MLWHCWRAYSDELLPEGLRTPLERVSQAGDSTSVPVKKGLPVRIFVGYVPESRMA